jgi:hypothetical protein
MFGWRQQRHGQFCRKSSPRAELLVPHGQSSTQTFARGSDARLERQEGGNVMQHVLKVLLRSIFDIFADRLLQLLLLGTIGAAFLFAFVLHAAAPVVVGVLVVGCFTAFVESAYHRRKK